MSLIESFTSNWDQAREDVLATMRAMNQETVEEQQEKMRSDVMYVSGVHKFTSLIVELMHMREKHEVERVTQEFDFKFLRSLESHNLMTVPREPLTSEQLNEVVDKIKNLDNSGRIVE